MTTAIAMTDQSVINRNIALAGPVGSLDAYINAVGGIPVLCKEDEQALSRKYLETEDLEAARVFGST